MRSSASRSCRFLLPLAASLALPIQAFADWGENWGTMIWGQSAPVVPSVEGVGLSLLVLSLVGATTSPQPGREPVAGSLGCAPDSWGDGVVQLQQWGGGRRGGTEREL